MAESKLLNQNNLLILGIVGGLIGIYLSGISTIGGLISCLGGICAIVWGADAIRRVASYGLGTGVPSIGYMSLGIATVGSLAGLTCVLAYPSLGGLAIAAPILALIFTMIIGACMGLVAVKIIGMKIPIMVRCTVEIAGAASLSILAFSAAVAGGFGAEDILTYVVAPGFIALFYIMNCMAIQHPYNACLGPNEEQSRTLKCAASTAFLAMTITGIIALSNAGVVPALLIIIVGLCGWYVSFKAFLKASYEAAASVKWTGLWPKVEE